jgi:EAL domain-containing protein (putative c-di-GMP-specific phosphodiesterase class I)
MHNEPLCIQIINHLRELGIKLSLDDFGVAYSSLKYLKLFESDALKLDRTFVQSIPAQARDFVIVQAVIQLAHHLGMKVVAEGVETLSQLCTLAHWGCDMAQGYLISPPVPNVEFEKRFLQTLSWNVTQ